MPYPRGTIEEMQHAIMITDHRPLKLLVVELVLAPRRIDLPMAPQHFRYSILSQTIVPLLIHEWPSCRRRMATHYLVLIARRRQRISGVAAGARAEEEMIVFLRASRSPPEEKRAFDYGGVGLRRRDRAIVHQIF